jgi:hypothetical protein
MTVRSQAPSKAILGGARILEPMLLPNGFEFHFRGSGRSSGGEFARGEFVRDDRRLEFHFRYSLGLVRYHVGNKSASHESYMRGLGVWDRCKYPGFSDDPTDAFHDLVHDLRFAEDFLAGSAAVLLRAAATDAADETAQAANHRQTKQAKIKHITGKIALAAAGSALFGILISVGLLKVQGILHRDIPWEHRHEEDIQTGAVVAVVLFFLIFQKISTGKFPK